MLYLKYNPVQTNFKLSLEVNLPIKGIIALFGHSGAGKTTMLRIIAGLEPSYGGVLKFGDKIWQDEKVFVPPYQRKIGYVFQDGCLFNHLTVAQNLAFASKRSKIASTQIESVITDLGLENLLHRMPNKLSGGEKQRVVFARSLFTLPELLLLDEPFNALDDDTAQILVEYTRKLDLPTLYVSHSADEVMKMANYLVQIKNGELICHGHINKMLPLLGRSGFLLDGKLSFTSRGYCHYQTSIGLLGFQTSKCPKNARIFIDSRNMIFHQNKSPGFFKARINSIQNKISFYCQLNMSINGEDIEILVLEEKLFGLGIISGSMIFVEISAADIL